MTESQKEYLKEIIKSPSKIFFDEPMKKHTSLKIGGPAEVLIKVADIEVLKEVLKFSKEQNIPVTLIGNGSNILVLDGGIKGITLKIDIQRIEINQQVIKVSAGNKLIQVAYEMINKELTGMEELSGIPGTIGGAVYMNAGANGKEIKDIITKIVYLDENGEQKEMLAKEARFSYRHSIFSEKDYTILEVEMKLEKGNKREIEEKMQRIFTKKKRKSTIRIPKCRKYFQKRRKFYNC